MSEPPGLPSALGIEAVQWLAQGEGVTVRVQGRWRRRRPAASGQALLVVEAAGRRHRFPAMPEPPSVTGAAPGTWQVSFSLPASLASPVPERAWLQLGAVAVPLPLPVAQEGPAPPAQPGAPSPRSSAPELRSADLALEAARRRASEAERAAEELRGWIEELERSLALARHEPERLEALLAARERSLRLAEQRAFAERARRIELEEELAEAVREAGGDRSEELAATELRLHELEDEVARLRRAAAEAEHAARAALAAHRAPPGPVSAGFAAELGLRRRAWRARSAMPPRRSHHAGPGPERALLHRERRMLAAGRGAGAAEPTVAALRRELAVRVQAETRLRAELAGGRADPAAGGLGATLAELRAELDALRLALERETSARIAAERRAAALERELDAHAGRSARAHDAIAELRGQLASLRGAVAQAAPVEPAAPEGAEESPAPAVIPPAPAPRSGSVDPERFAAALARLREAAPQEEEREEPVDPGPPAVGPWLERAFRLLARTDAPAAGRLLVALLAAQGLVHPDELAYDLVLGERECVSVTVRPAGTTVRRVAAPRPESEVRFRLEGDAAAIARLLAAGRLRRRFGRGRPRVRGDRGSVSALRSLVAARLRLEDLVAAGVRPDPATALALAAVMIDPAWTAGEGFTVAYQRPGGLLAGPYLEVRDGRLPAPRDTRPATPVTSTICCRPELVLALLAGQEPEGATLGGERRPVELLREWLARAQQP